MEERGPTQPPLPPPPAMDPTTSFHEPLSPTRSLDRFDPPSSLPQSPIRPQQGKNANTIVVQVPRDQVYRVPPPENAYLASQYQRPQERKRDGSACSRRMYWLLGIILTVIVILAVASVAFYLVVRPRIPEFSVDRILIVDKKSNNESKPEYEFTVKITNPSDRMGYIYRNHGNAVLSHRGANIAANRILPAITVDSGDDVPPATLNFTMSSSDKIVLPADIEKSLKSPSNSGVISMILSMNFPVRVQIGSIRSWEMDMDVRCDLGIGLSSKSSSVLNQDCKAKLRKRID